MRYRFRQSIQADNLADIDQQARFGGLGLEESQTKTQ
jgi:hypothetical protein